MIGIMMSKLQAQARSVTSINQQTYRFISASTEVNFTVPEGQVGGRVGSSGGGKSTLRNGRLLTGRGTGATRYQPGGLAENGTVTTGKLVTIVGPSGYGL